MPVIAATDTTTDLGKIIESNNFGKWSLFGDLKAFNESLIYFLDKEKRQVMGKNSHKFMMENYLVSHSYNKIIEKFEHI